MKYRIRIADKDHDVELISRSPNGLKFFVGGQSYDVAIEPHPESKNHARSADAATQIPQQASRPATTRSVSSGEVRAPMPGVVVQVLVEVGKVVAVGEPVLIVEAMKMENTINSGKAGKVTAILVAPKQQVNGGDVLLTIG